MNQQRWIASVDAKGEVEGEPQPYLGPDDYGCQTRATTYGTSYRAIASTKEAAVEQARRCWERAQE